MPQYTFSELKEQAAFNVGRRSDLPDEMLGFAVNEAYMEVRDAAPSRFAEKRAFTTVRPDANRYQLPERFDTPINFAIHIETSNTEGVGCYTNRVLKRISAEEYDNKDRIPGGQPQEFVLFHDHFELWPRPDKEYRIGIRYVESPTDLVEDDDVPELSPPWRRAVLLKAEELLHNRLGNPAAAAIANHRYLDYVNRVRSDEARRQQGQYRGHGVTLPSYNQR